MKLDVSKKVLDKARRATRKSFPKEFYGYLLGNAYKTKASIKDIYIPYDLSEYNENASVSTPEHWPVLAKRYAESIGLIIVGDIHSHPYTNLEAKSVHPNCLSASPSEWDYDHPGMGGIQGIVLALQTDNGSIQTRVKLYGPQVQLQISIK
jgi:hypothetical protein